MVLLSEFDTAGHTDALEIPLLPSSDVIVADVELDQRPVIILNCGIPWGFPKILEGVSNYLFTSVLLQPFLCICFLLGAVPLKEYNQALLVHML